MWRCPNEQCLPCCSFDFWRIYCMTHFHSSSLQRILEQPPSRRQRPLDLVGCGWALDLCLCPLEKPASRICRNPLGPQALKTQIHLRGWSFGSMPRWKLHDYFRFNKLLPGGSCRFVAQQIDADCRLVYGWMMLNDAEGILELKSLTLAVPVVCSWPLEKE